MQTDTISIEEFIRTNGISMGACERVDANPNFADSERMDHWKVTLVRRIATPLDQVNPNLGRIEARMTTYFSMGYGHNGKAPEMAMVLDSLASDASLAGDNSFEDFCSELGYDPDSRKAEKTYKACKHSASRLEKFLGSEAYQTLVYNTERQ